MTTHRLQGVVIMIAKRWFATGYAVLLVCLLSSRVAVAQESDADVDKVKARVGQFLDGVALGTTKTAYEQLLAGSPLGKQTEAVEDLVRKTDRLKEMYGPYYAFEPIASRRVGSDLILLRYLYKCQDFPVVFYFTFYRTPQRDAPTEKSGNWRVIIVRFDTELELLALMPESKSR
jgi:hypothetical protein